MEEQFFRIFNFNEKETQLLKAIIERGTQPASRLAKFCNLPRNTARTILDRLVSRGILLRTLHQQTQFYGLERKQVLLSILEQEKQECLKDFDIRIQSIRELDDTFGQRGTSKRPKITLYEGIEGLKRVYEDTLTATTPICSWASFDENAKAMPKYFSSYYKRRAKKNIPMQSIHPDTALARNHQKQDHSELRESKLVPAERFAFLPEIQVYNNKVNIVSWADRIGVIIESASIAESLRSIFELSFEGADVYQAKKITKRSKRR